MRPYAILCWVFGALTLLVGALSLWSFVSVQVLGGESPFGGGALVMGAGGMYFVAFSGATLVAWGGCLIGAARASRSDAGRGLARSIGTATAVGLALHALYRLGVWMMAEYAALGLLPPIEAAVFGLLALAFIVLRPARGTAAP